MEPPEGFPSSLIRARARNGGASFPSAPKGSPLVNQVIGASARALCFPWLFSILLPQFQPFTAKENAVIEQLMEVILQHGLSADHAKTLLARTIQLLEWGKQAAHKTPQANA